MKTIFETSKHVVISTQKCGKGEYIILPAIFYIKEKPCKNESDTIVIKKSFTLGWLKGFVTIELTTEKPVTKKN